MLGTAKQKQRTSAPADVRELADVALKDYEGRDVRLGDLWADRPAALIFLRHYG